MLCFIITRHTVANIQILLGNKEIRKTMHQQGCCSLHNISAPMDSICSLDWAYRLEPCWWLDRKRRLCFGNQKVLVACWTTITFFHLHFEEFSHISFLLWQNSSRKAHRRHKPEHCKVQYSRSGYYWRFWGACYEDIHLAAKHNLIKI